MTHFQYYKGDDYNTDHYSMTLSQNQMQHIQKMSKFNIKIPTYVHSKTHDSKMSNIR